MKTEELAQLLGVSLRTTKSVLSVLEKEGKVSRVGGKNMATGKYVMTDGFAEKD